MESDAHLVFGVAGGRFALAVCEARRVVPAMWPRDLPGAPEIVVGAIDLQGRIVPVVDLRVRLGAAARPMRASDCFVIARAGCRDVALWVDEVHGLVELNGQGIVPTTDVLPDLPHVRGLMRGPEGLVLIADLERLLSLEEAAQLDAAMPEGVAT
jgi:purine-binding chemotaxis protein CheW